MIITTEKNEYIAIRLDKDRMDKALAADAVKMPKGLTKEQKREFIIERAKACQAQN